MDLAPAITSPSSALRPERELMLCAARTRLTPPYVARIHQLAQQDLDWAGLYREVVMHQVHLAVYASLSETLGTALPADIAEAYKKRVLFHLKYNILLTNELTHVLDLLLSHGVRVLPFKGPVLGQVAYGNSAQRPFGDLDLLIAPEDFKTAERLLLTHGYGTRLSLGTLRKRLFLHLESGYCFSHEKYGFEVDLHTRIAAPRYSYALDFEGLWDRSQEITLGNTSVRAPGAPDLVNILCWHGVKHQWAILKSVCDVAEMVEATPDLDWDIVRWQAQSLHATGILHVGLTLAHDLLGAELPREVRREMTSDLHAGTLANRLAESLLACKTTSASYFERHQFQLRMRETIASKIRYASTTLAFNKLSRRILLGS